MYYSLEPNSQEEMEEWNQEYKIYFQLLGAVNMALWLYVVRTEIYQLLALGKFKAYLDYFKSFWNWFDIIGLVLNLLITVHSLAESGWLTLWELRMLSAIASCNIFIKVFDWLRLFEKTAFYVQLISETLAEIRYFGVLILVSLLMFGLPLAMLNHNRDEDNKLVDDIYGDYWIFNVLINQGLAAMGNPYSKNYSD
mmetsp:Transcript_47285/g.62582  ORF Transcript_47285/g.62582 Transcript_47285/m.62582 type:complete len:196 (+) Transcript_47285:608-1195(+)